MSNNVQPERVNLLTFFQKLPNSQFVIPVYQRNYVWQPKKQVKKFLDDYSDILIGNKNSHFIGIMMYLQIMKGIGFSELSIVDGQQRLVTTFLILYALKELALESGDDNLANKIYKQFLINEFVEGDKLKLKPLVSDDDVYKKITDGKFMEVQKEQKKSNLYLSFEYIKKYLKEKSGTCSIQKMLDTLNSFYFVAIPLSEEDNAQEIFETINSAGYELTKADLIRNYLLMNLDSNKQEQLYYNYWLPLEKQYESSKELEEFFRMFLANQMYVLSDLDDIYDDFQTWNNCYSKTHSIEETLKKILEYSGYYCELFISDDYSIDPIVDCSLKDFRENSVEPTAPLLMEIDHLFHTFDNNGNRLVSNTNFKNIIELLNTYNIRRNICNFRSGVLTRIIPPMLKDIISACGDSFDNIYKYTIKFLVDNNKGKASFMPDDEYLKNNLYTINAYAFRKYIKSIFERIESENNPAKVDFSNLSIEHLMPQTPTKEWLDYLGITKEVYDANLHRLGNLTLATHQDNSKMSNKPFDFKKEVLKDTSHLKMNIEILAKSRWDVSEIDERTKEIIKKICSLYPYKELNSPIINKYSIFFKTESSNIRASIFGDWKVEVAQGSTFVGNDCNNYENLVEDEILVKTGNGFEFATSYMFPSLEDASNFIEDIQDQSVWEKWTDSNDNPLNLDLRTLLINKNSSKMK